MSEVKEYPTGGRDSPNECLALSPGVSSPVVVGLRDYWSVKQPEPGELWLDEGSFASSRKVRLLVINEIDGDTVRAVAISGGMPGPNGLPLRYFNEGMTWQGYWSVKHATLPRLSPPYADHPIAGRPGAGTAKRLHGTAALGNSILPSWVPDDVEAFDRDRKSLGHANLDNSIRDLKPGSTYLKFRYSGMRSLIAGSVQRQGAVRELWYQKQQNAWHLVRTLAPRDIVLP